MERVEEGKYTCEAKANVKTSSLAVVREMSSSSIESKLTVMGGGVGFLPNSLVRRLPLGLLSEMVSLFSLLLSLSLSLSLLLSSSALLLLLGEDDGGSSESLASLSELSSGSPMPPSFFLFFSSSSVTGGGGSGSRGGLEIDTSIWMSGSGITSGEEEEREFICGRFINDDDDDVRVFRAKSTTIVISGFILGWVFVL